MKQHRLMSRVVGLALGLAVAVATLNLASAQQEPPHRFYGTGATPGDMIGVVDDMGHELGSTEVAEDGSWYIDVDRDDADNVSFTLNGESADADVSSAGSGQSAVVVTAMAMEDSMDEGDSMDDGDSMEDLDGEEDGSMEDGDSMMDDGDTHMGDTEYPGTGSGGLADGSGVSAGLIGLLIALSVAAVAGLGLRRVRNRA